MESLARNTINYIRQDENYLAKKLYKGILEAAHQQVEPSIKEFEMSNVKLEDDISKMIDNLVTIYESKLNDIIILNNNILQFGQNLIRADDLRLLKNIILYNTILISWNYISKQLLKPDIPRDTRNKVELELNRLYPLLVETLENCYELINNIAIILERKNDDLLTQIIKFMSVTEIIKKQIENKKVQVIRPNDFTIMFNSIIEGSNIEDIVEFRVKNSLEKSTKRKGEMVRTINKLRRYITGLESIPEDERTALQDIELDTAVEQLNELIDIDLPLFDEEDYTLFTV